LIKNRTWPTFLLYFPKNKHKDIDYQQNSVNVILNLRHHKFNFLIMGTTFFHAALLSGSLIAAAAIPAMANTDLSGGQPGFSTVFAKGNLAAKSTQWTLSSKKIHASHDAGEQNLSIVLEEDFSGFTAGSQETPDATDLTDSGQQFIPEEYTSVPGWWGVGVYQAGGVCALQYPYRGGVLTSPGQNLGGKIVVRFKAKSVAGSALLMCNLLCGEPEAPQPVADMQSVTLEEADGWTDVEVVFENYYKEDDCYVQLNGMTYNQGIHIDDLKVYRDLNYVERPAALNARAFRTDGFEAEWTDVEGADSYVLNLLKEQPTGQPALNINENFDTMSAESPAFPEGWVVTTSGNPLSDEAQDGSQGLCFSTNDDSLLIPGHGGKFNHLAITIKPVGDMTNSMACIMLYGRVSEEAAWNPIVYCYAMQARPEGSILELGDEIAGLYTDLMLGCFYFEDGDKVIIDDVVYSTDTPTEIIDVHEYTDITSSSLRLENLDPEPEYYFTVSTVIDGNRSDPTELYYAFGVAAPVPAPATDITADGFTANWKPVAKATGYSVDLFKSETMEQAEADHVVLHEDFSKVESDRTPDKPEIIGDFDYMDLDNYTAVPGWRGAAVTIADGMLGCANGSGFIVDILTPFITLGNNDGNYTVKMTAYASQGCVLAIEGFDAFSSHTFTTDGLETFSMNLPMGRMKDRLSIYSANSKSFLIDEIEVCQDVKDGDIILEHILTENKGAEETSTRFNSLKEGVNYAFAVTSQRKKYSNECVSDMSDPKVVSASNSVDNLLNDETISIVTSGRTIKVQAPSGVAVSISGIDGTNIFVSEGSVDFEAPSSGIFIIKAGSQVVKTTVR